MLKKVILTGDTGRSYVGQKGNILWLHALINNQCRLYNDDLILDHGKGLDPFED